MNILWYNGPYFSSNEGKKENISLNNIKKLHSQYVSKTIKFQLESYTKEYILLYSSKVEQTSQKIGSDSPI